MTNDDKILKELEKQTAAVARRETGAGAMAGCLVWVALFIIAAVYAPWIVESLGVGPSLLALAGFMIGGAVLRYQQIMRGW